MHVLSLDCVLGNRPYIWCISSVYVHVRMHTRTCIHIFFMCRINMQVYAHTLAFVCFVRSRPHVCIHTKTHTHTWQANQKDKYHKICLKKQNTPINDLCKGLPAEFGSLFFIFWKKTVKKTHEHEIYAKASPLNLGFFFHTQFGFFFIHKQLAVLTVFDRYAHEHVYVCTWTCLGILMYYFNN